MHLALAPASKSATISSAVVVFQGDYEGHLCSSKSLGGIDCMLDVLKLFRRLGYPSS